MRMTCVRFITAGLIACLATVGSSHAATIAGWTFETSAPTTAGPHTAEEGAGDATGFHTSTATAYSNPVGNGSGESFSSNNWAIGDYYQFEVDTTGFDQILVSWDQTRSSSGPAEFNLQYSTDGTSFTTHDSYTVGTTSWSSIMMNDPSPTFSYDLSSVTALNNQSDVFFRLTANSAPGGTGGTNRVDNFTVANIPEPSTLALVGLALAGLAVARRRGA